MRPGAGKWVLAENWFFFPAFCTAWDKEPRILQPNKLGWFISQEDYSSIQPQCGKWVILSVLQKGSSPDAYVDTEGSEVWVGTCRRSGDGSFGRAAVLDCPNRGLGLGLLSVWLCVSAPWLRLAQLICDTLILSSPKKPSLPPSPARLT